LVEYTGRSGWPERGVYFFQEAGEYRLSQRDVPRVVRIGTHAVSANVRIPVIPTSSSGASRPRVPAEADHLFRAIPSTVGA
jgi:hypothetical protein